MEHECQILLLELLSCFIERKERNYENNGVNQQRNRRGPTESRVLAAMV